MLALPDHIHYLNDGAQIGDRVFINITRSGCGSGCAYCYIQRPKGRQDFVPREQIASTARNLAADRDFTAGRMGTIISLCPDSDPFKTDESTRLFEILLREIIPLGNPIQIPTKEVYPLTTLRLIAQLAAPGQVIALTSFTTISRAAKIEPGAASITERFGNFLRCRDHGVHGCLYLKPFLPSTARDIDDFVTLSRAFQPDSACIGIFYSTKVDEAESSFTHPVHDRLTAREIDTTFRDFVARYRAETGIAVFHSSVCVSAHALNRFPRPHIWRAYPSLCVGCRDCEADLQRAEPQRSRATG